MNAVDPVQAVAAALADPSVKGKPEWFTKAALGYDMTPLAEIAVDRIMGSNLTATVTALLEDVATQIEKGSSDDQGQV